MPQARKIGEILMERKLITAQQLQAALQEQVKTKEFLGALLLRKGAIKSEDLLAVLSEVYGIPCLSMKDVYIDWSLVKRFSASLVLEHKCVPVKKDGGSITVAIINPSDIWALGKAEEETRGLKLKLVLVSELDMEEILRRYKQQTRGEILGI